jgi:hypothetical protein
MTLNFILLLLLVIGLIVANLALLKYGSKPLPKKKAQPVTTDHSAASAAKSQAAASCALPFSQASTSPTETEKAKPVGQLSGSEHVDSPGEQP